MAKLLLLPLPLRGAAALIALLLMTGGGTALPRIDLPPADASNDGMGS